VIPVFCLLAAAMLGQSLAQEVDNARAQSAPHAPDDGEATDPLGRSTPQGTVFSFLDAARSGRYKDAAQYLQLSRDARDKEGGHIAHQLYALMESAFVERVGVISDHLKGSTQIGIPRDHERIGVFRINGSDTNVDLVHVSDPTSGQIWLFSSQVVAAVPNLFAQIENGDAELGSSRFQTVRRILNSSSRRVTALILLVPVSILLAWITMYAMRAIVRISSRWRRHETTQDIVRSSTAPIVLILAVIFHQIGVYFLGAPLSVRLHYQRLTSVILVAGVAWLVFRLINVWSQRARARALAGSGYRSGTIVLLGQRMFKVLAIIVAGLIMLSILGFEITTALAGLGIGSIALAFAAQKTLENLLGGISILSDEVIRIGEFCRIGDREGTVEDISLRSTRIRTLERTELSVPNGQLATMNVENISRRDKSLFQTTIGLRYDTSPAQLRSLLTEIRSLLRHHPKVDSDVIRVRLVGFGEAMLNVEVHCLILTRDLDEFMAIREELLFRIMDSVAGSGTELAIPARVLYMPERRREAMEETQKRNPPLRYRSS
jgi:MscS family membrane protein